MLRQGSRAIDARAQRRHEQAHIGVACGSWLGDFIVSLKPRMDHMNTQDRQQNERDPVVLCGDISGQ